jgi:hypothetical protein
LAPQIHLLDDDYNILNGDHSGIKGGDANKKEKK